MRAADFENRLSEGVMSTIATALVNTTSGDTDSKPLLQLNSTLVDQPITFSDVGNNLRLLMDKVILTVNNNVATATANNDGTGTLLSASEVESLYRVVDMLSLKSHLSADTAADKNNINNSGADSEYSAFLLLPANRDPAFLSSISYLSLLRLVVLQPAAAVLVNSSGVITRLIAELKDTSGKGLYKPPAISSAVRAVAMSVLVNYLSLPRAYTALLTTTTTTTNMIDPVMDMATVGMSPSSDSKVTLRMTASALAVNIAIACTTFSSVIHSSSSSSMPMPGITHIGGDGNGDNNRSSKAPWQQQCSDSLTTATAVDGSASTAIAVSGELHPHAVQMLCSVIECLSSSDEHTGSNGAGGEVNHTIRLRGLVIVYRILRHCGPLAAALASDLGLADIIKIIAPANEDNSSSCSSDTNRASGKDEAVLLREIRRLLLA